MAKIRRINEAKGISISFHDAVNIVEKYHKMLEEVQPMVVEKHNEDKKDNLDPSECLIDRVEYHPNKKSLYFELIDADGNDYYVYLSEDLFTIMSM